MEQTAQVKTWTWEGRWNPTPSFQSTDLYCFSVHPRGMAWGLWRGPQWLILCTINHLWQRRGALEGRHGSTGPLEWSFSSYTSAVTLSNRSAWSAVLGYGGCMCIWKSCTSIHKCFHWSQWRALPWFNANILVVAVIIILVVKMKFGLCRYFENSVFYWNMKTTLSSGLT